MNLEKDDSQLVESLFMSKGVGQRESGEWGANPEFDGRKNFIYGIGPLIKQIINSDEILFSVESCESSARKINSTKLGLRFVRSLRGNLFEIPDEYPDYKVNPYFGLFYSAIKKHELLRDAHWIKTARGDGATHFVTVLNDCIAGMRYEAKSKIFKARLKSYLRSVKENYKGLTSYVDALFNFHARMLILRIDLSYLEKFRGESGISFKEAGQHRRALLDDLAKGRFGRLLGFAWKFEKGRRKGLHYHLLLFFDGSQVRKDVVLGQLVGEHWRNSITGGQGSYYNCNAFKDGYEYCGIGMVHHTNLNAREGMRRIIIYMTKLDEYFKLSVPGLRSFGKGAHPKEPLSCRGRPRSIGK